MATHTDASTGKTAQDKTAAPPAGGTDDKGREVLQVKVYSPYKLYFDEPAYSVSAVNRTGSFDVLPHHHNFISLLEPCQLAIDSPRGPVPIKISGGILHVRGDKVVVFLDV